jgi:HEAT repeat protein
MILSVPPLSTRQREIVTAAAAMLVLMLAWKLIPQRTAAPAEPPTASTPRVQRPLKKVVAAPQPPLPVPTAPAPAKIPVFTTTEPIAAALKKAENATESEFQQIAEDLAKLGEGAVDDLGAALRGAPGIPAKTVLARALARIGNSESVDQLIGSLGTLTDPAQRTAIISQLGGITNSLGLETLSSSLAAVSDPGLRGSLITAVSHLATSDTVDFLVELYREPPNVPEQPQNVLSALGAISNPAATSALNDLAGAPELPLQYAAVLALSRIGTPDALEGLISAAYRTGDTNPDFRQAVLTALQNVTNPTSALWIQQQSASTSLPADLAASLNQALQNIRQQPTAAPATVVN